MQPNSHQASHKTLHSENGGRPANRGENGAAERKVSNNEFQAGLNILREQDEVLLDVMDSLKRKVKPNVNIHDLRQNLNYLSKCLKDMASPQALTARSGGHIYTNSFTYLLKQHLRTFFMCFAFITALERDILSHDIVPPTSDLNGGIQSILLNSLDYIRRNVRCLLELVSLCIDEVFFQSLILPSLER